MRRAGAAADDCRIATSTQWNAEGKDQHQTEHSESQRTASILRVATGGEHAAGAESLAVPGIEDPRAAHDCCDRREPDAAEPSTASHTPASRPAQQGQLGAKQSNAAAAPMPVRESPWTLALQAATIHQEYTSATDRAGPLGSS